ncbi:hypothetical protein Syun_009786 [Stephania yunnanensis]|uniref:Lipid-binding serum glycoprotein C-terminal domain-containing protein n=1 Tax=Stephania yunnanensis TaxID=152371 RepID=A0AAP0PPD1_9MAGN
MEVGLTLGLENQGGMLKLTPKECGCYVKSISISLNGGASWFYQGFVDAFEDQIRSAVENTISKKIKEGTIKLDSLLQTLPREVPIDSVASLNVTFVNEPSLGNSSIGVEINGLFTSKNNVSLPSHYRKSYQTSVFCKDREKMLGISLDELVFNSGASIYFDAGIMQWMVDKVPDQSLLNTASWKFLIPQLYRKFPNDDMKLNISFTSPPVIRIFPDKIDATICSDMTIDVLDANEIVSVACVSVVVRVSGSVDILNNNLAGTIDVDDFSLSLKWSQVGKFHMSLIQSLMWTLIKTVALPYANTRLRKGFPLPIISGFTLQSASITYVDSRILICSDVVFKDEYNFEPLGLYNYWRR